MRCLARCSLMGFLLVAALVFALHFVRADLDWRLRFMSEYALGASRPLMVLVFLMLAGSTLLLAVALAWALRPSPLALPAAALLGVWAVALVGLVVYPDGRAHDDVLLVGKTAFALGVLVVLLHALRGRRAFVLFTLGMGALAALPHLYVHVLGWGTWAGLAQRLAGVAMLGWLVVTAWRLGHGWGARGDQSSA